MSSTSTLAAPCRFTAPRSGHTYDFTSLVRPPGQDYAMPDAGQPNTRFQYHYNFCGGVVSRPSGGNQDLGVQVSLAVHHMHHTTFLPTLLASTQQCAISQAPSCSLAVHHMQHTHMHHTRHFLPTRLTINTTMRHLPSTFLMAPVDQHEQADAAAHTMAFAFKVVALTTRRVSTTLSAWIRMGSTTRWEKWPRQSGQRSPTVSQSSTFVKQPEPNRQCSNLLIGHSHAHKHGTPCSIHK
jgi:hypothetical protein